MKPDDDNGTQVEATAAPDGLFAGSGRGFVVAPEEGSRIDLAGGWVLRIKVAASDTAGAATIVEGSMPPGHTGPPPHVHGRHDESFIVLAGSLRFRVGSGHRDVVAGETVFASRGLVHGFANPHDDPARYLCVLTPSGYEFYFHRLAELVRRAGGPPDRATLLRLMREYETFPVDANGALASE